jgi:hypothetical protein
VELIFVAKYFSATEGSSSAKADTARKGPSRAVAVISRPAASVTLESSLGNQVACGKRDYNVRTNLHVLQAYHFSNKLAKRTHVAAWSHSELTELNQSQKARLERRVHEARLPGFEDEALHQRREDLESKN